MPCRIRISSSPQERRNGSSLLSCPNPPFLLTNATTQTFVCKKCKKAFRKDAAEFEESDEYCPHCDNHFVLEAVTAKPMLKFEGEDARIDSRMLKDDRMRGEEARTIFNVKEAPN
jgi:hypothetical protein